METVVDLSAPEAPMTTDEAAKPAGRAKATRVGSVHVHVEPGVAPWAHRYDDQYGGGAEGWVTFGPVTFSGTWADLDAMLAAGLAAVRVQSTGPVGG
ncbi:MAG: hypothetical protein ACLGI3_14270 [Actinomycetes bacterium]